MKIQQSMLRSYHAFAKSHLLIDVTFSTPTGLLTSMRLLFAKIRVGECYGDFSSVVRSADVDAVINISSA